MAVINNITPQNEATSKEDDVSRPPHDHSGKGPEANRGGKPKQKAIDLLSEEEKIMEKRYLEQMAAARSPWTARTRIFLGVQEPSPPDLSLSPSPDINRETMLVKLDANDQLPVLDGWGMCLAGIFTGRFPGKDAVQTLIRRWPSSASVSYHSKGWMFFQFPSLQGLRETLGKGPYSIFGIPLHLEPITDDFSFSKELEIELPVWIRLPDLPPLLWTKSAIEKMASSVGVPIAVDEATIQKECLDGPRIQIKLNAKVKPKDCIDVITASGKHHTQKILFESKPKFCVKCKVFGHYEDDCQGPTIRGRQFWKPQNSNWKRDFSRENRPQQRGKPGQSNKVQGRADFTSDQPYRMRQEKGAAAQQPQKGQNNKGPAKGGTKPPSRPPSPNRYEPLAEDNLKETFGEDKQQIGNPGPGNPMENGAEASASYHNSDTAMQLVAVAQNLEEQQVDERETQEIVGDNWESHVIPTSPIGNNGDANTSDSSNAAGFVSDRTKGVKPSKAPPHQEDKQAPTGSTPEKNHEFQELSATASQEEIADQAIQKIILASKQKQSQQPSNKKKKGKSKPASKYQR